jgi:DNA polymerase I-like protein with 3'-5' exonuclease and polymerase domains
MSDLTGTPRKAAKAIYLGLCYGEGGGKLAEDLGLPTRWAVRYGSWGTPIQYFEDWDDAVELNNEKNGFMWKVAGEEAQGIIDQFNDRAPYIKKLADYAKKRAEKKGKIRTVGGRVLNFELLDNGKYDECRRALNRLIQGSAADQTKRAMVEVDKAGHHIMLQVHDELDNSVEDKKEAEQISEIMQNAITGLVPFRVDTETGPNWGEIK